MSCTESSDTALMMAMPATATASNAAKKVMMVAGLLIRSVSSKSYLKRTNPQKLPAQDQLLDLRRALVQREADGVAEVALHRVLGQVADAAVQRDRCPCGTDRCLSREVL